MTDQDKDVEVEVETTENLPSPASEDTPQPAPAVPAPVPVTEGETSDEYSNTTEVDEVDDSETPEAEDHTEFDDDEIEDIENFDDGDGEDYGEVVEATVQYDDRIIFSLETGLTDIGKSILNGRTLDEALGLDIYFKGRLAPDGALYYKGDTYYPLNNSKHTCIVINDMLAFSASDGYTQFGRGLIELFGSFHAMFQIEQKEPQYDQDNYALDNVQIFRNETDDLGEQETEEDNPRAGQTICITDPQSRFSVHIPVESKDEVDIKKIKELFESMPVTEPDVSVFENSKPDAREDSQAFERLTPGQHMMRKRYRKAEPRELELMDDIKDLGAQMIDKIAEVEKYIRGRDQTEMLPLATENLAYNDVANLILGVRHVEDGVSRVVKALMS